MLGLLMTIVVGILVGIIVYFIAPNLEKKKNEYYARKAKDREEKTKNDNKTEN